MFRARLAATALASALAAAAVVEPTVAAPPPPEMGPPPAVTENDGPESSQRPASGTARPHGANGPRASGRKGAVPSALGAVANEGAALGADDAPGGPGSGRGNAGSRSRGQRLPAAASLRLADESPPGLLSRLRADPEPGFGRYFLWDLLALPETLTRFAISPLALGVVAAERYRLDRRVEDLLTNEAGTSLLLPAVLINIRDGLGVGLNYTHSDLRGNGETLNVAASVKQNRDHDVALGYLERVPWLDGRQVEATASYELDNNERYFGIGNDTRFTDRRVLQLRTVFATVEMELLGPITGQTAVEATARAGYLFESLEPGTDVRIPSVQLEGDTVAPPPGFSRRLHFVRAGLGTTLDLRDTEGRTTRGTVATLTLDGARDVSGANLSSGKLTTTVSGFIPVAPKARVLRLSLGAAGVVPLAEGHEVPLEELVWLGRSHFLRGYAPRRFRDVLGWWAVAEYRYPIFDLLDTGGGLSSVLFLDVGRVANEFSSMLKGPIRYSWGIGLRAETSVAFILRAELGFSPEGPELLVSLNEAL